MVDQPMRRAPRNVRTPVAFLTVIVGSLVLGLGPVAASSPPIHVNVTSQAPGSVHPDSASGCNQSICIAVTGSGLNVSDWTTTAVLPRTMCSTADFLVNGSVWATGYGCASSGDQLKADWSDPGNFANGTVLCNTWSGIAGKPCETVEG